MVTKRTLLVVLVGLNLALVAALILSLDILPRAQANPGGRPGDFAACTVKVHEDYDGLYVVDQAKRKLHLFVPSTKMDGTLTHLQTRDLDADFRRTK